jgi:hypothetical protein
VAADRYFVPVLVLAFALLSCAASSPARATVSGHVTVDGIAVRPAHAVALWSKSTAYGEQGKPVLRVLMAAAPIDRGGIDEALDREGALRAAIEGDFAVVTLDAAGKLSNFYVYIADGSQNYGLSNGVAAVQTISGTQVVGRAFTEGAESLGDTTISYDLSFSAEILPERPAGKTLGAGGGAPGAAYTAYLAAIRDGDIAALIAHGEAYTAERLRDTEEEWLAEEIAMLREMAPQQMTVTGGEIFDDWAILTVKGLDESGSAVEGAVKMALDGDSWRLAGTDLDYVW